MTWRIVIGFVVWYLLSAPAMLYGNIWDSQANPKKDVLVLLVDGGSARGSLSRNWDKSWTLTTREGVVFRFDDFRSMAYQAPADPRGFSDFWRSLVPVVLISVGFFLFVFFEFFPALRRSAWRFKPPARDNGPSR